MKHAALLLSLLVSTPLFAMNFGEAKSTLAELQTRVKQLDAQREELERKIEETQKRTGQMSGQQEFAEEMRKHTARLASSVKQHKTLLEKLKAARQALHDGVERIGQHHNISSDGNGKFSVVERKSTFKARPSKVEVAEKAAEAA